jgi:hypothetical protein
MKQEWNAATLRGIYRDGNRSDTVSSENEFRLNMIEEQMVIWLGLQEASIKIQDLVIWGELLD